MYANCPQAAVTSIPSKQENYFRTSVGAAAAWDFIFKMFINTHETLNFNSSIMSKASITKPSQLLDMAQYSGAPTLDCDEFIGDDFNQWRAKGSPDNGLIKVHLSDIVLKESLQVRQRTYPSTVRKYAEAMQAGKQFPPVRLACINGVLFLVDGWHRVSARSSINQKNISAVVTSMTYKQAKWTAAQANMDCGLPLNANEVREAFHSFMEARMYRQGHTWLSYRQIGELIGKPHTTIRNWMQKHYPRIFKHYQQIDPTMNYTGGADTDQVAEVASASPFAEVLQQAQTALDNTKNIGKGLPPETLGQIIEKLRETLRELEMYPYELSEF